MGWRLPAASIAVASRQGVWQGSVLAQQAALATPRITAAGRARMHPLGAPVHPREPTPT